MGIHHVWARGNAHGLIYRDDGDRALYLENLRLVVAWAGWRCLAYCLMDNHVHLLIETPRANLGKGMQRLHGLYGRQFNDRHGRTGHVFQGRFGSKLMGDERQLWTVARYIARNPVEAGMCESAGDWSWGGHPHVLRGEVVPWLDVGRLLSFFAGVGGNALRRYREFVDGDGDVGGDDDNAGDGDTKNAARRRVKRGIKGGMNWFRRRRKGEVSAGGSTIYRHEEAVEPVLSVGDPTLIEAISAHIEAHVGEPEGVYHQQLSPYVHVDIHVVPATDDRPWITLVTSGMSERAMVAPPELGSEFERAELVLALPPDWPVDHESFSDERHYWPFRLLQELAALPHQFNTWLWFGHTVPHGEPADAVRGGHGPVLCAAGPADAARRRTFRRLHLDGRADGRLPRPCTRSTRTR